LCAFAISYEVTSEKQALLHMQKEYASAILGTHTHIGTDDEGIEV